MTNLKRTLKTTKSSRQRELEERKGTREYQLRVLETHEAEAEIKRYKIPPCVGHAFKEEP